MIKGFTSQHCFPVYKFNDQENQLTATKIVNACYKNVNIVKNRYLLKVYVYFQTLKPSGHLFPQISRILRLTRVQEVVFGLALLNSSSSDIRNLANQFVKQKLPDLLRSYVDAGMCVTSCNTPIIHLSKNFQFNPFAQYWSDSGTDWSGIS